MNISEAITNIRLDHQLGLTSVVIADIGCRTTETLNQEFTDAVIFDQMHTKDTDDVKTLFQQLNSSDEEQIVIVDNIEEANYSVLGALYSMAVTGILITGENIHEEMSQLQKKVRFVFVSHMSKTGSTKIEKLVSASHFITTHRIQSETFDTVDDALTQQKET